MDVSKLSKTVLVYETTVNFFGAFLTKSTVASAHDKYNVTIKSKKINSALYSLNTLSGVTSERSPRLCARATHQRCIGGESLAACGRLDRLGV